MIVGSMKENSRVGEVDEADITLLLDEKYKNFFIFDQENQKIKFSPDKHPDECLLPYKTKEGDFDTYKYYIDYITSMYDILKETKTNPPSS